jgi:hypothetical protein
MCCIVALVKIKKMNRLRNGISIKREPSSPFSASWNRPGDE